MKSNDKLNEVPMIDLQNETSEDQENYILDDKMGTSEDPVNIQILKKPKTIDAKSKREQKFLVSCVEYKLGRGI